MWVVKKKEEKKKVSRSICMTRYLEDNILVVRKVFSLKFLLHCDSS